MAAVGAFASARANQGSMRVCNALPANIIVVTNSGTILLTSDGLQISHSVTINGPGAGTLAVNGNGTFRAFVIFASDVTISGFTITNGFANDGNGGGGINNLNGTTTTVSNCNISGNFGGGISNVSFGLCCATLTVTNSTISDNSADYGGGILDTALDGGAFLTVTNSTISNNSATSNGGAILSTSGAGPLPLRL